MNKPLPLPPLSLGRAEAAEILNCLRAIDDAMRALPFRDYLGPNKLLTSAMEAVEEACPGGFLDSCEGCGQPIGLDDAGVVSDPENGIHLCPACGPSPEEIAAQQAAIAAAEGWVPWAGGECPLHPYAPVEVRFRDGTTNAWRPVRGWIWRQTGADADIVAYRLAKPEAFNHREDGEFGEGATMVSERLDGKAAPAFTHEVGSYGGTLALPPGHRLDPNGTLIVDSDLPRPSGLHPIPLYALFKEIRTDKGEVIKTADKNWAPPEAEELQLLRQLMRGPVFTNHSATRKIAARLDDRSNVMLIEAPARDHSKARVVLELTALGKRRLDIVDIDRRVSALEGGAL